MGWGTKPRSRVSLPPEEGRSRGRCRQAGRFGAGRASALSVKSLGRAWPESESGSRSIEVRGESLKGTSWEWEMEPIRETRENVEALLRGLLNPPIFPAVQQLGRRAGSSELRKMTGDRGRRRRSRERQHAGWRSTNQHHWS